MEAEGPPPDPFLEHLRVKFNQGTAPMRGVHALMAFRIAVTQQQPAPEWATRYISEAIGRFLHDPAIDMDKALEIVTGKGQDTPRAVMAKEARGFFLMLDVWKLGSRFGVSVADAAHMVQEKQRMHDLPSEVARWEFGVGTAPQLNETTIADRFVREGWNAKLTELMQALMPDDVDWRDADFLNSFPEHSWPHGLKSRISVLRPK